MQYNITECGSRIKELRKASGLTQAQLSFQLNIRSESISAIENGRRAASIDLLIDIAQVFDVTLDYLILGRVDPTLKKLYSEAQIAIEHMQQMQKLIILGETDGSPFIL